MQEQLTNVTQYNFDHPDAFDTETMLQCIADLKAGKPVDVPVYDFTLHQRARETKKVGRHGTGYAANSKQSIEVNIISSSTTEQQTGAVLQWQKSYPAVLWVPFLSLKRSVQHVQVSFGVVFSVHGSWHFVQLNTNDGIGLSKHTLGRSGSRGDCKMMLWYKSELPCKHCTWSQVDPADVIIVEGILVLHIPEVRQQLSMKIYVDTGRGYWVCRLHELSLVCGGCLVSGVYYASIHISARANCPGLTRVKATSTSTESITLCVLQMMMFV